MSRESGAPDTAHLDSRDVVLLGEGGVLGAAGFSVYSSFSLGATLREPFRSVSRPGRFPQHPLFPSLLRVSVPPWFNLLSLRSLRSFAAIIL
jgi:hypothetical protein